MDNETFRVLAAVAVALAALVAAVRGMMLIRAGEKGSGGRFLIVAVLLLALTVAVVVLQNG